jgi:hypothetical protein
MDGRIDMDDMRRNKSRTSRVLSAVVGVALALVFVVPGGGSTAAASSIPSQKELNAVVALSPDDAWAVGWYHRAGASRTKTFALHWDGVGWSRVWTPNGHDSTVSALLDVSAAGPNDIWAVGRYDDRTLTLHWDGARWHRVSSPIGPSSHENLLFSVSAISANDVWAVGRYIDPNGTVKPMTMHWNGIGWSQEWTPNVTQGAFNGVSATSSDVWAVGWTGVSSLEPMAVHRDASGWSRVPVPALSSGDDALDSVSVLSATDVWTVGVGGFRHWDGDSWTVTPQAVDRRLQSISATSATDVWAAGDDWEGNIHIHHFDGSGWSVTTLPRHDRYHTPEALGVSATSSADAWVVGIVDVRATGQYRRLILHWDGTTWTRM